MAATNDMADLAQRFAAAAEARQKREEEEAAKKIADEEALRALEARYVDDPRDRDSIKLKYWEPDAPIFWKKWGFKPAVINLAISTINLALFFAIWGQWGMITGLMNVANENDPDVYSFGGGDARAGKAGMIAPIAGISGGTQRVVHTWMVHACGGRTTNFLSMVISCVTMFFTALALSNKNVNIWAIYILASLCGIGGGAFSSCLSNISFFFPTHRQGAAMGVEAGIGNLGVSLGQQIVPRVGSAGLCVAGKTGECDSGPYGGKYPYNVAIVWCVLTGLMAIFSYFFLNDMPHHGVEPTNDKQNFGRFFRMQLYGNIGSYTVVILFFLTNPIVAGTPGLVILRAFLLSIIAASLTMGLTFFCHWGGVKESLQKQLDTGILTDKNTLIMTLLYIMTFGSFIGYARAFPKLLAGVFDVDPASLAWLGAFCGSWSRVAGGFLSDHIGGAVLTQIAMTVQVLATIIAGIVLRLAQGSDDTSGLLAPFIFFILSLFTATGIGNASTFKQMAVLTSEDPEKRGPLLGFTAAIAAYGAFVIPTIFGAGIGGGFIDICFYAFSIYYIFCGALNYWYYARPGALFPC